MKPLPARPLVIQTERLHAEAAAWLAERAELVVAAPGEAAFDTRIGEAAGLVVRTYTPVDDALLGRAPALRVVGRAGVGLDNIDLTECAARGVTVVYTPDANTRAVVEYVFALLLDALRPRTLVGAALEPAAWARMRREHVARRQLAGLTMGIYGFGRVGRRVAGVATALDMRVLYHDLLDIPAEVRNGAEPVSRQTLLRESDIVTVHVDGRRSNRGLVDAAALALMKPDAVLVNTSRGFTVDPTALAAWLDAQPDALALLDVHEPEPFGADYPLLTLPNARLSPHLGAATALADRNMSRVVEDVWRVLRGDAPRFPAPVV